MFMRLLWVFSSYMSNYFFIGELGGKYVLNLSLHYSEVIPQLCTNNSPHPYMNAVRFSPGCGVPFMRPKVAWLAVVNSKILHTSFLLSKYHENLCGEYKNLRRLLYTLVKQISLGSLPANFDTFCWIKVKS